MKKRNRKNKEKVYVSFSEKVKEEYQKLDVSDKKIINILELAGIYRMNSSIGLYENKYLIKFTTRSLACILRIEKLVESIYGKKLEIIELNDSSLNKKSTYIAELNDKMTDDFLSIVGFDLLGNLIDSEEKFMARLDKKENSLAYIRGTFLGAGSITDPNKGYNLEIVCSTKFDGQVVKRAFENLNIECNIRQRKDRALVYIKNSDEIGEFLAETKAFNSYLEYEDIRARKSTSNQFNRTSNFETSNLDKQLEASARQNAYLEYIDKNIGFDNIQENLREVAKLRIENKDKTIKEIGEMLNPALSKSGVNYRLKKLEEIALKHMEKNKEAN